MRHITRFIKDQTGAELVEYAAAAALLVAIGMVVYSILGQAIADQNSGTGAKVRNVDRSFPFN
jgi:Flp pilus assembly pilin Flp